MQDHNGQPNNNNSNISNDDQNQQEIQENIHEKQYLQQQQQQYNNQKSKEKQQHFQQRQHHKLSEQNLSHSIENDQQNISSIQYQQQLQQQQQQQQSSSTSSSNQNKSVSVLFYKTFNTVFKSSRKLIVRVCEVASSKKPLKMFNLQGNMRRGGSESTTGHDRFGRGAFGNTKSNRKRQKNPNHVRRTSSANEFDSKTLTAAHKRVLFSRPNLKYQYTALDSGGSVPERGPKERASRERALSVAQEWTLNSNGRYNVIAHLDEIGSRTNKNWFLISDSTVRTERLMTLLPLPPECIALDELPQNQNQSWLELLGSLHHPYIYPVLDLEFLHYETKSYVSLVMPFNPRGSLKDLIYKTQWNDQYSRKYAKKPSGLPASQVQRLGRQILEALLFLKDRGFQLHGHIHSGNVIIQNGVARLTGLENGLLGLTSRINAVMWSRSTVEIENIDVICFGHLLYEMCMGYELATSKPIIKEIEEDFRRHPQAFEIIALIFDPLDGVKPAVEDLVLCDWFRSIDLRELRGPCVSTIKPSLSRSTLSLFHAVKKRQVASMNSFSDSRNCSPCTTPPSTPKLSERPKSVNDSFEISSDSESALDEVIVTSSSYDSHHYDPLQSPIHFCDNSLQSDDSSIITGASGCTSGNVSSATASATPTPSMNAFKINNDENEYSPAIELSISPSAINSNNTTVSVSSNQLTADICNYKNSKSRRLEYGRLKYGRSNPSQDSAFGSLTDGELSVASSFRLSSFQSISSPIDEGVEDIIIATTTQTETNGKEISLELFRQNQNGDSATSTPSVSRDYSSSNLGVHSGDDMNRSQHSLSLSPKRKPLQISSSISNLQFDPPKILVNDQNSIYTTSPSKKSGTLEVFSQKYRVSSFEDMSPNRKNLKQVNKMAFRSLEEERRIDSAFMPIKDRTNSENRVNSEKYKKLTHSSFRGSDTCRTTMWKDSLLYRKTKIAKSNDSILDSPHVSRKFMKDNQEEKRILNRGQSVTDVITTTTSAAINIIAGGGNNSGASSGGICSSNSSINECGASSSITAGGSYQSLHQTLNFNNTSNINKNSLPKLICDDLVTLSDNISIDKKPTVCSSSSLISERQSFCLSKLKQTAITDCVSEDEYSNNDNKNSSSQSSINQQLNSSNISSASASSSPSSSTSIKNSDKLHQSSQDSSEDDSLHQDVCKIIGGMSEEKTPLLDSVEMSPISPNEPDNVIM
ncbi:uncharacterized protein LOC129608829 isoform X2 [Condylostylus longicornis]|uniref:uncharacterized protein LOC129608829 isoform X2 n=1 Tax=Condylostylus longicornis TaxID=2530218 RepID=UPI00244DF002|nr:uncharacterized protein LOC129608829 isoform X2 [Condylostylus longicornis]